MIRHIMARKERPTDETFYYQQLFLMSPSYPKDAKLRNLVETLKKTHKVITCNTINKETIAAMTQRVASDKFKGIRSFVYIDDPVGQKGLTDKGSQESPFNAFVANIKHDESGLLFTTQIGSSASTTLRETTDVFILMPNRLRRKSLFDVCPFTENFKDFNRMMDAYASSPYNALWINVKGGGLGVYSVDPVGRIWSIEEVPP